MDINSTMRQFCYEAERLRDDYDLPDKTKAMLWDLSTWLRRHLEEDGGMKMTIDDAVWLGLEPKDS